MQTTQPNKKAVDKASQSSHLVYCGKQPQSVREESGESGEQERIVWHIVDRKINFRLNPKLKREGNAIVNNDISIIQKQWRSKDFDFAFRCRVCVCK